MITGRLRIPDECNQTERLKDMARRGAEIAEKNIVFLLSSVSAAPLRAI